MVEILRKSWYNITIVCFLRGKRVYLRSLEIQGFKSFPDKTVLQFDSDITAIVGPNGSGKSNISDAISWVMGEQSSKALRGAKMEDVIFGGTLKRPAVGYAEATLVLDNQDGTLPVETPEVMITRRYYAGQPAAHRRQNFRAGIAGRAASPAGGEGAEVPDTEGRAPGARGHRLARQSRQGRRERKKGAGGLCLCRIYLRAGAR